MLRPPPLNQRVRWTFPDPENESVLASRPGFERAVTKCQQELDQNGIVFVLCKGGNHRAPTVASRVQGADYVVNYVTVPLHTSDIVAMVMTCWMPSPSCFIDHVNSAITSWCNHQSQYTVAWRWYGFYRHESSDPFIQVGDAFLIRDPVATGATSCVVTACLADGRRISIPFGYAMPLRVPRLMGYCQ